MDRNTLKILVDDGLTQREIAEELSTSQTTIRYWLRKHGLQTKHTTRRVKGFQGKFAMMECKHHGETEFVYEARGSYRCKQCRVDAVAKRRKKLKRTLVEEAGGACVGCGYDSHIEALHFHHVDPSEKEFGIAGRGVTMGIDTLRKEASKCVLLCANCHAEVEHCNRVLPGQL